MKKFAVSVTMTRMSATKTHTRALLYLKGAASKEEAIGASIVRALDENPDFEVGIVVALEIPPRLGQ